MLTKFFGGVVLAAAMMTMGAGDNARQSTKAADCCAAGG